MMSLCVVGVLFTLHQGDVLARGVEFMCCHDPSFTKDAAREDLTQVHHWRDKLASWWCTLLNFCMTSLRAYALKVE